MTTDDDSTASWPLSDAAARQINRLRKQADLNREQLAERCRKYGAPATMTAAAIANIETGRRVDGKRRRDVTVDELAIFARALNVPPTLLLFEVGRVEMAEVLPDVAVPAWVATQWFTGEGSFPGLDAAEESEADHDEWLRNSAPLTLFREYARLVLDWSKVPTWGIGDNEDEVAAQRKANDDRRREIATEIRRVRDSMRMVGLRPPPINKRLTAWVAGVTKEGSTDA